MAVARTNASLKLATGGAPTFVSDAMTNVAGRFLIAFIGWEGTGITCTGVADTLNGAWTLLTANVVEVVKGVIAYRENIAAGSNVITASFSGTADYGNLPIYEYSGLATSASLDAQAASSSAGGASTGLTTGAMSVTDGGLLFTGAELFDTSTRTPGNAIGAIPWVERQDSDAVWTADLLNQAPGSYIGNALSASSVNWVMCAAAFKAAGGPPVDLSALIGEPICGASILR